MTIAEHLSDNAEVLKHRPEFTRAAKAYCDGMDAEAALHAAAWVLMSISELLLRPDPPSTTTPSTPPSRPAPPLDGALARRPTRKGR
jgi:hypothetical protein